MRNEAFFQHQVLRHFLEVVRKTVFILSKHRIRDRHSNRLFRVRATHRYHFAQYRNYLSPHAQEGHRNLYMVAKVTQNTTFQNKIYQI